MKYVEFEKQMDRLKDCYGEQFYSKERTKLFWDRYKAIEKSLFSTGITSLIVNNAEAPLLEEFDKLFFDGRKKTEVESEIKLEQKLDEQRKFQEEHKNEEIKHYALKKEFSKKFPEKNLLDYVKYWYGGVFGQDQVRELTTFGLTLSIFSKPALFDLERANWIPKKAVEIGLSKI